MLIGKRLIDKFVQNIRFCSVSAKSKNQNLLIRKITYPTDDWTNIKSRFEPFVGVNLHRRWNHPLKLVHDEVVAFFRKWFHENVDSDLTLPVYDKLGPIEPNTSTTKEPNVFYVNRDYKLRVHTIDRQVKLLNSGVDNYVMTADLYRQCQMDAKHFPVFHRTSVVRTLNCEELPRHSNQNDSQKFATAQRLKDEQQAALIEMAKCIIGTDVKYRWTEANLAATEPSWMFELWHQNEWCCISGGGLIRNEIYQKSERVNTAGWEIALGLDRLAMILYNVFDIRLLWNADQGFLSQFEPKNVSKRVPPTSETQTTDKTTSERAEERPTMIFTNQSLAPKKKRHEMHISYILPSNIKLESFSSSELCDFIVKNTDGVALDVGFFLNQ